MPQDRDLLLQRFDTFPRLHLAHLPTPLERLEALNARLEGPTLWMKRDDATGLAFGGNKARKLEYILADAQARGADTIVTWAGVQSNWCRQTAAAAARLGLRAVLVLFRKPPFATADDGNLLLDRLLGAEVHLIEAEGRKTMAWTEVRSWLEPIVKAEQAAGHRVYVVPVGGSMPDADMKEPWGALAYLEAFREVHGQATALGVHFDAVVHATGSGATQAGLLIGARLLSPGTRIIGVSVSEDAATLGGWVRTIADRTLALLGSDEKVGAEEVEVLDGYVGAGYGHMGPEVAATLRLLASTEGVLLDPVYTGKAMTALLDLVGRGVFTSGQNVLFIHTGGTPALFPYREGLSGAGEEGPRPA
jgi:L-cysteate sulfo-lyase